jgi:hypothetical protein
MGRRLNGQGREILTHLGAVSNGVAEIFFKFVLPVDAVAQPVALVTEGDHVPGRLTPHSLFPTRVSCETKCHNSLRFQWSHAKYS